MVQAVPPGDTGGARNSMIRIKCLGGPPVFPACGDCSPATAAESERTLVFPSVPEKRIEIAEEVNGLLCSWIMCAAEVLIDGCTCASPAAARRDRLPRRPPRGDPLRCGDQSWRLRGGDPGMATGAWQPD